MRAWQLRSFVATLAIILAGCGQTTTPAPTPAQASGTPVQSAVAGSAPADSVASSPGGPLTGSALIGTYATTIPEGQENAPPGDWQLMVTADGIGYRHPDGHTFSPGTVVAVTADEITFAADPACPGQTAPTEGRYSWAITGTTLTFTEVEPDSCLDRAGTLTTAPWTRTGA
jgi:hypothetical protein